MQIVSSYGVEIKKKNIPLHATLDIFRKAFSESGFLFNPGVCRDLERTFRNQEFTKTL